MGLVVPKACDPAVFGAWLVMKCVVMGLLEWSGAVSALRALTGNDKVYNSWGFVIIG